jgi:hypothetical protein
MDAKSHRWFEQLKKSVADRVDIGLFQGCDIVHELMYRSTLREQFFPHAVSDALALRELFAKTGTLARLSQN